MRLAAGFCLWFALVGGAVAQDTSFPVGPQYLITTDSPQFLRPIATPSLSFETASAIAPPITTETVPASEVVETPSPLPSGVDLARIFWGVQEQKVSEIEITGQEPPRNLPPGFVDTGVTAMVEVQSLREQGYGISLGDLAAFWKTHKGRASHTYTNRDIQRLDGG